MKRQKTSPSRRLAARWMGDRPEACFRHAGVTYTLATVDELAALVAEADALATVRVGRAMTDAVDERARRSARRAVKALVHARESRSLRATS